MPFLQATIRSHITNKMSESKSFGDLHRSQKICRRVSEWGQNVRNLVNLTHILMSLDLCLIDNKTI